MAATVLVCHGRPKTTSYMITSKWFCSACRTQQNDFRSPPKSLQTYQDKGYIRKVSPEEEKPDQVWYLPNFPVLKPDKSTTKTRIVFDASAKYEDVSLNDVLLQGSKLKNDLFAVLLRFRRDPVALMCDEEMFLQIKLKPTDRPYHSFLVAGDEN